MLKKKLKLNPTMAAGAIGNARPYRSISGGTPYIPPVRQKKQSQLIIIRYVECKVMFRCVILTQNQQWIKQTFPIMQYANELGNCTTLLKYELARSTLHCFLTYNWLILRIHTISHHRPTSVWRWRSREMYRAVRAAPRKAAPKIVMIS